MCSCCPQGQSECLYVDQACLCMPCYAYCVIRPSFLSAPHEALAIRSSDLECAAVVRSDDCRSSRSQAACLPPTEKPNLTFGLLSVQLHLSVNHGFDAGRIPLRA